MKMTKNMYSGLIGVVLGLGYLFSASRIPTSAVQDAIGPKPFPFLVGFLAVISGGILCLKELRIPEDKREAFSFGFLAEKSVYSKMLAIVVAGIAYGMLLDPLGYILSTAGFMLFLTFMLSKKVKINLILSTAFPIITYVVFSTLLSLSLPRGILGEIFPYF